MGAEGNGEQDDMQTDGCNEEAGQENKVRELPDRKMQSHGSLTFNYEGGVNAIVDVAREQT